MTRRVYHRWIIDGASLPVRSLLIAGLTVSSGLPADGQEHVGIVTAVNGQWVRSGAQGVSIASGYRLLRSDTLAVRSSYTPQKYVVALLHDGRRVQFTCPASGLCNPFVLGDSLPSGSLIARTGRLRERVWTGILDLLSRDPRRYSYGLSRGGAPIREAVVRLDNETIELGPAFESVSRGRYAVVLTPLQSENRHLGTLPTSATMEWPGPRSSAQVRFAGVRDGLYVVDARPVSDPRASPNTAWLLLISSQSEFRRVSGEFAEARAVADNWRRPGDGEIRAFLRAALETLGGTRR